MTAEQVKAFRALHSLSQSQLAEALGVHVRTLSAWEQGRQIPPRYVELALCELARRLKRRSSFI